MFETIAAVFSRVVLIFVSVLGLHLGCLRLARALRGQSIPSSTPTFLLIVLVIAGSIGLWRIVGSLAFLDVSTPLLPTSLKVGALCLYLGGCLIYVELRSLLSRGYSLRILIDLLNRGGSANLETLKLGYGEGVGIPGMLTKRLGTLVSLRLLCLHGDQIGPLTRLGKVFAMLGLRARQLLRLEDVG